MGIYIITILSSGGGNPQLERYGVTLKRAITKISEEEIIKNYPLKSRVTGWFFKQIETSNNAWTVEGMDQWGRKVSRSGGDPEELFIQCEQDAEAIRKETNTE